MYSLRAVLLLGASTSYVSTFRIKQRQQSMLGETEGDMQLVNQVDMQLVNHLDGHFHNQLHNQLDNQLDMQNGTSASTWPWSVDPCAPGYPDAGWGEWWKNKLHVDMILRLAPSSLKVDCSEMMKAANLLLADQWIKKHLKETGGECLKNSRSRSDLTYDEMSHIFPDLRRHPPEVVSPQFFTPCYAQYPEVTAAEMIKKHLDFRAMDLKTNVSSLRLPFGVTGGYNSVVKGQKRAPLTVPTKCAQSRKSDISWECVCARLFVATSKCAEELMNFMDDELEHHVSQTLATVKKVSQDQVETLREQLVPCDPANDQCFPGFACTLGRQFRGPISAMVTMAFAVPGYAIGWPLKVWLCSQTSGFSQWFFGVLGEPEICAGLALLIASPIAVSSEYMCRPTTCNYEEGRCKPIKGSTYLDLTPATKCVPKPEYDMMWRETGNTVCDLIICPNGEGNGPFGEEFRYCDPEGI